MIWNLLRYRILNMYICVGINVKMAVSISNCLSMFLHLKTQLQLQILTLYCYFKVKFYDPMLTSKKWNYEFWLNILASIVDYSLCKIKLLIFHHILFTLPLNCFWNGLLRLIVVTSFWGRQQFLDVIRCGGVDTHVNTVCKQFN